MSENDKICPLLTKGAFEYCVEEHCAWWNTDKQKCSAAVVCNGNCGGRSR